MNVLNPVVCRKNRLSKASDFRKAKKAKRIQGQRVST